MIPIVIGAISHSVKYSIGAILVGKDAHGPGPSPYLSEISLKDIGGADLFPELFGKRVIVEAMVKVLFHASDRSLGFYLPFFFPSFEAFYSFAAAGGSKDSFSFGHAGFKMHSFQLGGHIPKLMNNASLHLEERIDLFDCFQKGRITVSGDELKGFALKPTTLEIDQEGTPAVDIFLLSHLE